MPENGEEDLKLTYSEEDEVAGETVADTSGDSIAYVTGWGYEDVATPIERYAP